MFLHPKNPVRSSIGHYRSCLHTGCHDHEKCKQQDHLSSTGFLIAINPVYNFRHCIRKRYLPLWPVFLPWWLRPYPLPVQNGRSPSCHNSLAQSLRQILHWCRDELHWYPPRRCGNIWWAVSHIHQWPRFECPGFFLSGIVQHRWSFHRYRPYKQDEWSFHLFVSIFPDLCFHNEPAGWPGYHIDYNEMNWELLLPVF